MFFPYQDENPSRRWPVVTILLIAANAGIYLLFGFSPDYESIVQRYGFIPSHPSFITLLTSIFLHAGVIHLAGNMWYLWLFGDNVESRFGSFFLPFYLVAGLAGSWLHTIFSSGLLRDVPCIGASGAISGVLGAYLALYPGARVNCFYFYYFRAGTVSIQAGWFLGFWIFFQLLFGILATSAGASGVAYLAHIGGFAFGVAIGLIVRFSQRLPTEVFPQTSGPSGIIPEPVEFDTAANAQEIVEELISKGDAAKSVKAYLELERRFPYTVLKPDYQFAIAKIMEDHGQPHMALFAYKKFINRYQSNQKTPLVYFRTGMLYTDRFGHYREALANLRLAEKNSSGGEISQLARTEIEKLESHLSKTTFEKKVEEGLFSIILETSEQINVPEVAKLITKVAKMHPTDAAIAIKRNTGFIIEDAEGYTAKYIAEQLEAMGTHVLIVPKEKIVLPPEAKPVKLSEIDERGLTILNGELTGIEWERLLFLSWGLVGKDGSGPYDRVLDIFTRSPLGHYRIKEPSSQSIFELVQRADDVPVNEGLVSHILKEAPGRYMFPDIDSWDRYNRWQLQLAILQRSV